MTKEEGVRLYNKAVSDYNAAQSEKRRCQSKVDEWTGSRSSYIRQRDAKTREIQTLQTELEKEYANKRKAEQALSATDTSHRTDNSMRSTLSDSVSASDTQGVSASHDNTSSQNAQLLVLTQRLINQYENEKSIRESERRDLESSISSCDGQIRTYNDMVFTATRNMRTYQQRQNDYRKYLYM